MRISKKTVLSLLYAKETVVYGNSKLFTNVCVILCMTILIETCCR
jgi:hypothetical protein